MVLAENISEEVAFRFILKGEGCEPGQGQALCSQSISNSWVSVNRWRKKKMEKNIRTLRHGKITMMGTGRR